jgi:hypothetical protein
VSATSKLKDWIQGQKDSSVSLVAEKLLQEYVEPYGSLRSFSLNSRQNAASFEVLLKGETEPITVDVQEYQLIQDSTGSYVAVTRVNASREWLTSLLQDFVVGRRLAIPRKYASYAKMLL